MHTKRFLVAALAGLAAMFTETANAQQGNQLSNSMFNTFLSTPAAAGAAGFTDARIGFRRQVAGLGDGPLTFFATANGRLGSPGERVPNIALPIRTRQSFARSIPQPDRTEKMFVGLGGSIMADRAGAFTNYGAYASAALNFPVYKSLRFAVGVSGGLVQQRLDVSQLNFNDGGLGAGTTTKLTPDVNAGALLYNKFFYLGYSANQLLGQSISLVSEGQATSASQELYHLVTAGVKLPITESFSLTPAAQARLSNGGAKTAVDYTLRATFNDVFYVMAGARNADAIIAGLGLQLNDRLSFGYAYDYVTNSLNAGTSGSHEAWVGVRLGKRSNPASFSLFR